MSTELIIAQLIAERDKLNRAIEALNGPMKRRGRPPKNTVAITTAIVPLPNYNSRQKECGSLGRRGRNRRGAKMK